ncbi:MAG: type IV toxin-antitoxin system AbiEi family antitoxin [Pseudomonadota bacterium]|nr:type IV toxin-antitoxin system AbiEi family antitoxin [Pseudomonadota bacterium]
MGLIPKKQDKLKSLLRVWPMHTIATASWLQCYGFTYDDLSGYEKSGWISRVGAGSFKRKADTVSWEGAIYGIQQQYLDRFHIGGRTALELQGAAHFVPLDKPKLFLFSTEKKKLPLWLDNYLKFLEMQFSYLQYTFLPADLGLTAYNCGEFQITISTRERAALEVVELLNRFHDFEECRLLFENLGTLRSQLVQQLLENCTSIKAKRVFLFLSKRLGHKWIKEIDITHIDLGSGPRYIMPEGVYDPEFQITYPKGFFDDDKLEV